MFELSQLRCFVAVAEELSFSRAAIRRSSSGVASGTSPASTASAAIRR